MGSTGTDPVFGELASDSIYLAEPADRDRANAIDLNSVKCAPNHDRKVRVTRRWATPRDRDGPLLSARRTSRAPTQGCLKRLCYTS
jgi:hypothetical protein